MKKTTAQKDFEREQKNLRNRIKRLEESGYELEDSITQMQKIKYASVSPKAASNMKVKMKKMNKEMLTQSSKVKSFTTVAGNVLTDKEEIKLYKKAIAKRKRNERARIKKLEKAIERKYNKDMLTPMDVFYKSKEVDDFDNIFGENEYTIDEIDLRISEFEQLNDSRKIMIHSFYRGLGATMEAIDEYDIDNYRLLKAIQFMQDLHMFEQIEIIMYLANNTTEFISIIWDSDNLFDVNGISKTQFDVLEQKLQEYGYSIPSDDDLKKELELESAYKIYDRKFIRNKGAK